MSSAIAKRRYISLSNIFITKTLQYTKLLGTAVKMRGTNPAWVILISEDDDVDAAFLSGSLIRKRSSGERVVAFVTECVNSQLIAKMHKIFHQVIIAPEVPKWWENRERTSLLLLQSLTLTSFSSLVIVRPGVLVFWSFNEALEAETPRLRNPKGDWVLVGVVPNSESYVEALSFLKDNGSHSFDTQDQFILETVSLCNIGLNSPKRSNKLENVLSWSDLKFYTGLQKPLIFLNSERIKSLQNGGEPGCNFKLENIGFWQKALYSELVSLKMVDESIQEFPETRTSNQNKKDWVAVIGMSCRFPNANSIEEYWQVLTSGLNTASSTPSNRLGKCELTEKIKGSFLKCPIDEFDASFFEIPPSLVETTDPQARLLMEVSWEAFEDAGINPQKLRGDPVGVFYGSWLQEYKEMLNMHEKPEKDFRKKYAGNGFGSTAGRLSFFYGFTGPNIATESACSSSLMAVQIACENLKEGHCSLALASGANVILQMDRNSQVLWAKDGMCRSFDSKANGYGRGEGIAVLILKRYSDAVRDGDKIQGIILGSASSQEGLSKSAGTPTVENERRTMTNALVAAKIRPVDVDYVEAHATGTAVGDPIEAEAIVKAYSPSFRGRKQRITPLLVGSVKTNIGHTESCSGIASIIKVLLAMKHEIIPPHINVETLNPKVDFSQIPGKITVESEEWKRSTGRRRIAGISNFGITGTDVHMIIQEPELQIPALENLPKLPLHVLTLSAKTSEALEELTRAFITLLEDELVDTSALANITYTANACRAHHHPYRVAVVEESREELIFQLQKQENLIKESGIKLNLCFVCEDLVKSEDFEQYFVLYTHFPAFQISMDACDAVCNDVTGFSPITHMFKNRMSSSTSDERELEHIQFCSFSVSYSLYKLWESWGVKVSIVLGVNFGEVVGAAITGKLMLKQCFQLIQGEDIDVGNKPGVGFETGIKYFSAMKEEEELGLEYWKQKCCTNNDGRNQQNFDSALSKITSKSGCNAFIHGDLQRNLSFGRDEAKARYFPAEIPPSTSPFGGLARLISAFGALYTSGYPVDWEGFYYGQKCRRVSLPNYPFQRKSFWYRKEHGVLNQDKSKIIPQVVSKILHPLLGNYVPSATSESESNRNNLVTHIFENLLVVQEQAPYLSDHVISSELIFPGAAHLELLLASNTFQGGDGQGGIPCVVEDFQIKFPLHLILSQGKNLRTVMSKQDEKEKSSSNWKTIVEAPMKTGEGSKSTSWKTYASGVVSISQNGASPSPQFNLEEIQSRCGSLETKPSESYKKLSQIGLKFGVKFQSIQRFYHCESTMESLAEVFIPEDAIHYICHPLLSDAMLQCFMFHTQPKMTTLHVPVSIKRFVCYRRLTPQECSAQLTFHIYCNSKENTISLLDSKGNVIASMTEPEFKATTASSILAAAGVSQGGEEDVPIWEVIWKPAIKYQTDGSLKLSEDDIDFTQSPNYVCLLGSFKKRKRVASSEEMERRLVDRLCELYVYKAFYELGWEPKKGGSFEISELEAQFEIAPTFRLAFRHYLTYFEGSGLLEISGESCRIIALPEKVEQIEDLIPELIKDLQGYAPLPGLIATASVLARILQAKVKGQQILFTGREEDGLSPVDFIMKNTFYKNVSEDAANVFFEVARHLWEINGDGKGANRSLRILEVGAGTGSFTGSALPLLEGEGIECSYFFTDISSHFLKKAETSFPNLVYKILDVEKEPLTQGFPPSYFDIIVGLDVLHATKNLRKSIKNLKMLLKTGGHIILGETNKPIKELDLTFGIVDGYWRFEDFDIRPNHCTIAAEKWLGLLEEGGFCGPSSKILLAESHFCIVVGTLSHTNVHVDHQHQLMDVKNSEKRKKWLLIHDTSENQEWVDKIYKRMSTLDRILIPVSISHEIEAKSLSVAIESYRSESQNLEGILCLFENADEGFASNNCRSLLEPLLNVFKCFAENRDSVLKLCVATSGLWKECEAQGNPALATLWGFVRCARVEIPWIVTKLVDLDPDVEKGLRVECLVQEMWMGDDETEVVYRKEVRYTRRLAKVASTKQNILSIPAETDNYSVQLPKSKLLTDLLYAPKGVNELGPNQVRVEVRAASLNFRDMIGIMHPSDILKGSCIGMDFSGEIMSIGENLSGHGHGLTIGARVFGLCLNESTFSRYINVPVEQVAVIPPSMTFAEAAALPVAALTALHCLINVANASPGQTVLIHAASGGVGIFAIQIAKYLGLNIVATAGSPRKRKFLKNQLGIHHVFNSRTLEYGEKIKEITSGDGVDIVLNCLTGPGFKETSLEICKNGGHFVEISKLDIWTVDEAKKMKPGVNYTIVNLQTEDPTVFSSMFEKLSKLFLKGSLTTLPLTRFTASRIVTALQLLQKAKHIGKVVVEMPMLDPEKGIWKDNLFNDRSSYLITGGKGAIGLAIAEWMVSRGAKYLVLLGRSSPKEKALEVIHKLEEEDGANILCVEADVADFQQMKKVFQDLQCDPNLPPLRGIHHCAGVLSDRMIGAQNWENFEYVLNPKVKGAYNLHKLTVEAPLEFFILHSSLTCTLGNPGQSNYAAGSLYMEALIESRLSIGLQGMSISWGHWNAGLAENLELEMMDVYSIQEGIAVLERFFMENRNSGGVGYLIVPKICRIFPPYEKTFFEEINRNLKENMDGQRGGYFEDLKENLSVAYSNTEKARRLDLVREYVRSMLCETLGLAPQEVADDVKFSRMGLDSLLSIELYNKLQSEMGNIQLGYIDMELCGTVKQVAEIIAVALDNSLA